MIARELPVGCRFIAAGSEYEVLKPPTPAGVYVRGRASERVVRFEDPESGEVRERTFTSVRGFTISGGTVVEKVLS